MHTAPTPVTGTATATAIALAPSLTLANEGVRVFLHSANEERDAITLLQGMRRKRKHGTPESDALWVGICAVDHRLRESVEKLRDRGGLLHLGAAKITVDYSSGEYVLRSRS